MVVIALLVPVVLLLVLFALDALEDLLFPPPEPPSQDPAPVPEQPIRE